MCLTPAPSVDGLHKQERRRFLSALRLSDDDGPTGTGGAQQANLVIRDGVLQPAALTAGPGAGSSSMAVLSTPELRRAWEAAMDDGIITKVGREGGEEETMAGEQGGPPPRPPADDRWCAGDPG